MYLQHDDDMLKLKLFWFSQTSLLSPPPTFAPVSLKDNRMPSGGWIMLVSGERANLASSKGKHALCFGFNLVDGSVCLPLPLLCRPPFVIKKLPHLWTFSSCSLLGCWWIITRGFFSSKILSSILFFFFCWREVFNSSTHQTHYWLFNCLLIEKWVMLFCYSIRLYFTKNCFIFNLS